MGLFDRHQTASNLRAKQARSSRRQVTRARATPKKARGLSPNTKWYQGYEKGTQVWLSNDMATEWFQNGWVIFNADKKTGTLFPPGTANPKSKILPAGVPVKIHNMNYWDVNIYNVLTSRPGQMRSIPKGPKKRTTKKWYPGNRTGTGPAPGAAWIELSKDLQSGVLHVKGSGDFPVTIHQVAAGGPTPPGQEAPQYKVLASRPGQLKNPVTFDVAPTPPAMDVCYDAMSSTLVSNDAQYQGHPVDLVSMGDADDQGNVPVVVKSDSFGEMSMLLCPTSSPPPNGGGNGQPDECCADIEQMKLVCTDPNHPLHGATILDIMEEHPGGLVTLSFQDATGNVKNGRFRLCDTPDDDGECCYDAVKGEIVCDDPNHPWHGQKADIQDEGGGLVQVCFAEGSAQRCIRIPLCGERPPECCYDAETGLIICTVESHPWHGMEAQPIEVNEGTVTLSIEGTAVQMPLCPDKPPIECCYDLASGVLRCPGNAQYDGLEVSLDHLTDVMEDGKVYASVSHPDLPGGRMMFPLCHDEVPPDCCYDGETGLMVCTVGDELHGKKAGVVHKFQMPDGAWWVYVAWNGGGARVPLCDEEKCPPTFCCVNVLTNTFVCPGGDGLNDQPADVAEVVTDGNGNNFAKLVDGTLVPVCGAECPPPEICPDCPPGMWLSPDKQCRVPECPPDRYPPGDGRCPPCPKCEGFPCDCPPKEPPTPPPWLDQNGDVNFRSGTARARARKAAVAATFVVPAVHAKKRAPKPPPFLARHSNPRALLKASRKDCPKGKKPCELIPGHVICIADDTYCPDGAGVREEDSFCVGKCLSHKKWTKARCKVLCGEIKAPKPKPGGGAPPYQPGGHVAAGGARGIGRAGRPRRSFSQTVYGT